MDFLKGIGKAVSDAAETTKEAAGSAIDAAAKSGLGQAAIERAEQAGKAIDDFSERTGTKAAIGAVGEKWSEGMDSLSGENVMRELQRRLDGQDVLNDTLAARLHEALTRIEALERKVGLDGTTP